MTETKPAFVFVHGYWHGAPTWKYVAPMLAARGHETVVFDLPGAGINAKVPASYLTRDMAAFSTEPSPNGGVTQEERTTAVIEAIRRVGRPVVLVGHSMGGVTVSDVAEKVPELLLSVVYLTAFMLPPGMPAIAVIQHETMESAVTPSLFKADPAVVGALRIDPRDDDPAYRALLKAAFGADVADNDLAALALAMHCDEPFSTALRPSAVTRERFGALPRHYIRCTEDGAIALAGQDFMIRAMDSAMGDQTHIYSLPASHSPFYSMPERMVEILTGISD